MRGALITVRCGCGQTAHLAYGAQWTCPSCGARWDMNQIPADQYWGIMREMRRYRLVAMGVGLAIGAVGLVLTLLLGDQLLIPVMILLSVLVRSLYAVLATPGPQQGP